MKSSNARIRHRHLAWLFLLLAALWAPVLQAEVSGGEIRVGLLVDLSSVYKDITGRGSIIAAQMAIEDAGGKVAGYPVHLDIADSGRGSAESAKTARQWIDTDGMDVIADVVGSPQALAVQEVVRGRRAVVFYNGVMSDALTGERCAPNSVHWMYDGHGFNRVLGQAVTAAGMKRWFFISVDNAFGRNVEASLQEVVRASGGTVSGTVRHPLGTRHLFAHLRTAAQPGVEVIGLINAGQDLVTAVRDAFDLLRVSRGELALAAPATTLNDIHLLRPELAQGLLVAHAFYWNRDAESRAFSHRFMQRAGSMPNDLQAGVYSALTHYFKAVSHARSDDPEKVMPALRGLPIIDPIVRNARLRPDGRMVHDLYLLQVKKPREVHEPWDYLDIRQIVAGDAAFRPVSLGGCPLVPGTQVDSSEPPSPAR